MPSQHPLQAKRRGAQVSPENQPSLSTANDITGDTAAGAGQRTLASAAAPTSFPFAMTAAAAQAAGSVEAASTEFRPAASSPAQQVAIQINRAVATGGGARRVLRGDERRCPQEAEPLPGAIALGVSSTPEQQDVDAVVVPARGTVAR